LHQMHDLVGCDLGSCANPTKACVAWQAGLTSGFAK
jgi:hypothetical protein